MAIVEERRERDKDEPVPVRTAVEVASHGASHGASGGWLTTAFSAVAVIASCVSVYVSTLQAANFEVYLPPALQYAMDGEGENFTIPITIANGGARSGTVISMELEVHNPKTNATQRFYSAYLGQHPRMQTTPNVRQFAPMTILGNTVHSDTVRFYPVSIAQQAAVRDSEQRIVQGEGDYSFRLKLNTAAPPEPSLLDRLQGRSQPAPVSAQMTLPVLDHRGVMQMRSKEWLGAQ
jgi:hypothetical protein